MYTFVLSRIQPWHGIILLLWLDLARIAVGAPIPVYEGLGQVSGLIPIAAVLAPSVSENFDIMISLAESGPSSESLDDSREATLEDFSVWINVAEQILGLAKLDPEPEPEVTFSFALDYDEVDEDPVVIDVDEDYIDIDDEYEDCVGIDLGSDEDDEIHNGVGFDDVHTGDRNEDNLDGIEVDWEKVRTEMLKLGQIHSKRQMMNPYIPPYRIV
ncbi:hypothetical protein J3R30DRAFT_3712008 [Lentinula aciculospora]|uniref:Uncharacterized protein n=1 Tax=Lentinula aciculospora TaxID=153920 RepID=A0A9W8ZZ90_9AGAR|nr:hypothetical protein J3R30DRAFT_3712008 [Lentinula aciculospora]